MSGEFREGMSIHRILPLFVIFRAPVAIFLSHIVKEKADLMHIPALQFFEGFSALAFCALKNNANPAR
jgi:hypothetical protein